MRLTSIRVRDFKRHASLELEPAAGLTVIRGPNEAGKSTLQQAIVLGLFRKADANRDDIRKATRWGAEGAPEVEIGFEIEGANGRLRKRFAGTRGDAELTLDGETITDNDRINEVISDLTGVPSEAFYRATASVGHAELADVSGDEPVIRDRLQTAISGADRGTGRARRKLEKAIYRYRTAGQKNPGLLKVLREEIGMLERELAEGERSLQRLEADRAAHVEASARYAELDRQLSRHRADLAEARRAQELAAERDGAQDRYDRLKRAAELDAQAHELRVGVPTRIPLATLRGEVARARTLDLELSEVQADLDAEAVLRDEFGVDAPPPPRPMLWLGLAVALFVAAGVAWFLLAGPVGAVAGAVLAAAGIVTLVQTGRVATRRRRYGLAQQLAEATAAQLHEEEQVRQATYRRRQRELEDLLEAMRFVDVEQAEAALQQAEEHHASLARIEGELQGLGVDDIDPDDLERARDRAANEAAQASHALAAMGRLGDDPDAAVRTAQREVDATVPDRDGARSEADQAQGRVDANLVDAEVVAGLAERLAAARERERELQRRLAVYQGTLDAIEAAEAATLKTAARFLEERMGPSISTITDGRYDEIEVDEADLDFLVRVPETGELMGVSQLSQGTADQLFLTARLGLVQLVTMDRRPPLILDDPFVTFDRSRGERALRLVKRVADEQGFQVLYLTCSDRYDALADELIVLPGPSTDRVLPEPTLDQPVGVEPASPAPTLVSEPDPRPDPHAVAPRRPPRAEPEPGLFDALEEPVADDGKSAAAPAGDPETVVAEVIGQAGPADEAAG